MRQEGANRRGGAGGRTAREGIGEERGFGAQHEMKDEQKKEKDQ